MGVRVVALAALLVLAGCITPFGAGAPDPATTPEDTADPESGTPASADTATQVTNPWGKPTLTVGVVNTAGPWRNITDHVADAIEYWEDNDAAYGRYEVDYDLKPNASDPDIVVRYVENISAWGPSNRDHTVGYAPLITADNPPDLPERICVRAGFNDESTRHVIEHEFGHLLGIRHGEPPSELMRPDREYQTVPRPATSLDAASHTRRNLSVYVDRSTVFARRDQVANQQLDHVYEYYKTGADGSIGAVDITTVEEREAADVVITFPRDTPCYRPDVGSCATLRNRSNEPPQLAVAITTDPRGDVRLARRFLDRLRSGRRSTPRSSHPVPERLVRRQAQPVVGRAVLIRRPSSQRRDRDLRVSLPMELRGHHVVYKKKPEYIHY